MNKDIIITIEGQQSGTEDEMIIQTCNGTCHLQNDKYYIQFEEFPEGGEEKIKNLIKISMTQIEMLKRGGASSQMAFDINRETEAIYHTPYGSLCFQVRTTGIQFTESDERIEAILSYALYSNDSHISDHSVTINIIPR